ncbi:MAG TPA: ArsR family transcriptional regulator, partial [Candidatus Thermoplasmatota archaeon]|nr:ArsR family transcriptional regulator [Candidatus Thermoplasmatota archaeon]
MDDPLELATRRRLYALVKEYPGVHVREAARQLGTSMALVEYHLALLREHGLVSVSKDDGYARLYPGDAPPPGPAERGQVGLLRQRLPLRVTLTLLDDGPAKHKDLAEALGLGKSTLSFHLRKLEAAGLVVRDADGRFAVKDPPRVLRLLLAYPPTRDLRQAFADVWLS